MKREFNRLVHVARRSRLERRLQKVFAIQRGRLPSARSSNERAQAGLAISFRTVGGCKVGLARAKSNPSRLQQMPIRLMRTSNLMDPNVKL